MLLEFLLRRGGDGDVAAEHDGARGRGALIDGQHKGHDVASPGRFWLLPKGADWERFVNITPSSSLRKQGPIATGGNLTKKRQSSRLEPRAQRGMGPCVRRDDS